MGRCIFWKFRVFDVRAFEKDSAVLLDPRPTDVSINADAFGFLKWFTIGTRGFLRRI